MKSIQQTIFSAVLFFVPQQGWTEGAFWAGVKKSGASATAAKKAYPRGIDDVAQEFRRMIDEAMLARIKSKRNFAAMRVRDKITFAVRARLEIAEPYREALRRLLVWALLPRNVAGAARDLWRTADMIWGAAGDTSTDYNYYTKRVLLIAVMKSVLSFWLNDKSKDYRDTWAFLDRRIEDVMTVGKGVSIIKTVGVSDILSFVRSRFAA